MFDLKIASHMTDLGNVTDPFSCVDLVTSVTVSDRTKDLLIITFPPHHNSCTTNHPSVQAVERKIGMLQKKNQVLCTEYECMQFPSHHAVYHLEGYV